MVKEASKKPFSNFGGRGVRRARISLATLDNTDTNIRDGGSVHYLEIPGKHLRHGNSGIVHILIRPFLHLVMSINLSGEGLVLENA